MKFGFLCKLKTLEKAYSKFDISWVVVNICIVHFNADSEVTFRITNAAGKACFVTCLYYNTKSISFEEFF